MPWSVLRAFPKAAKQVAESCKVDREDLLGAHPGFAYTVSYVPPEFPTTKIHLVLSAKEVLGFLQPLQPELVRLATTALRSKVFCNRNALAPFRLPSIGQELVATLLSVCTQLGDANENTEEVLWGQVHALGLQLGKQGLSHESMQAIGAAFFELAVLREAPRQTFVYLHNFLSEISRALVLAERTDLQLARDGLQQALERVLRDREEEMRRLIQELSTPLMPIHEGILALPLIGRIDAERAARITESLLSGILREQARVVLIDVSGVPEMDADIAVGLLRMAQSARLIGSNVVLTGMRADLAQTMGRLSLDLTSIVTLPSLRAGIEYAVRFLAKRSHPNKARLPKQN